MCVNNDFIEQYAYKMYEEINKSSLFTVVRVEGIEGTYLTSQILKKRWDRKNLITKLILQDKYNNCYVVNPDSFGLKFANGEISYKEYEKLQKLDDFKWISFSLLGISFLCIMLYFLLKFFN
ncbi:hypothetical protein M3649_20660 [Ureibacillus chungkukjangi]|uniref:hypothetical protein n=1 Tax=Ureibacillus chungkukjangi TaxID=1202712 RepID=UPI00203D893E|nr:hypothetical protein [Ureibacillus chungkukjangi]MCM3390502.1 hypothetical protein [Ureibacillus chungkukjangi]